jgi:hypothetical protein
VNNLDLEKVSQLIKHFNFADEILSALNNKMHVGGISCDLAKAFDCVNHESLQSKLHFYGIRDIAVSGLNHTYMSEGK